MNLWRKRSEAEAFAAAAGEEEKHHQYSQYSHSLFFLTSSSSSSSSSSSPPLPPPPPPPPPLASSSSSSSLPVPEEASPDSKCPICLDRFNNLAYLDRCLHRFCFPCIQEWSHNKAECPLCKQPFASILHSVLAEDDFKEYTLRPPTPASSSVAATVAMVAAMASAARNDHQMRLIGERKRREEEEGGGSEEEEEEEIERGEEEEEEEGFGSGTSTLDLASGGRCGASGIERPWRFGDRSIVSACECTGSPASPLSCCCAFRLSPAPLERLRPWLRRELTVLYGVHTSLVDIVQRIVTARLQRHGLEDQNTIEEELRPFLLARTNHFLHEMVSFASSPLALESYDLEAVYEPPDDAIVQLNDDSSDGSVIAISEEEEEEEMDEEEAGNDEIPTGSCLSLAAWDDETPGPSYSLSPANQEAAGKDEEGEEEEECL
ncbi:hypothetical protein F7725_016213, partial [Dissostichus mawsoni]